MQNRAAHYVESARGPTIATVDLPRLRKRWLLDGDLSDRSPKTLKSRRDIVGKLAWFLDHRAYAECGLDELEDFFLYLKHSHEEPGGRWGNPAETSLLKPLTLPTYHAYLRAFWNWLVKQRYLYESPMELVARTKDPGDEVMPFTDAEVEALVAASKKTTERKRDYALVMFLLDTGARASEAIGLLFRDLDLDQRQAYIRQGKGK